MAEAVLALPPFHLAPLSTLVTMSGSLVIGLAAVERAFPPQQLWQAAELDELWQAEQWGDDDQALARRAKRHGEFMTTARFAELAAG
jgi:chaperone required for assembly of F1-ATPase